MSDNLRSDYTRDVLDDHSTVGLKVSTVSN